MNQTGVLSAVFWCLILSSSAKGESFAPPQGKTLLVVGQDHTTIQDYLRATGVVPAGFMLYTSVQNVDGLDAPVDYGGGVQFGQDLLKGRPQTVLQIGLYMAGVQDGIVSGGYDDKITRLARWTKACRRPVYLRIGYEFDLPQNNYEPKAYVLAFRHIVDRFRQEGAANVAFVWHSYGYVTVGKPMTDWYPGDDYVDWVGVSFFNAYNKSGLDHVASLARELGKPLMIAEATPFGVGTRLGAKSWKRWFEKYFAFIDKYDVGMACYINGDWEVLPLFRGQGWGDARIQADPAVKKAWLEETAKERYLHSSPQFFSTLRFSVDTHLQP